LYIKNCLNLGDDDFIKLSDNSNLHFPGDVTISMWIYNGVTSQTAGTLINKGVQSNINPYWYAYTNYGSNKKSVFWQFTNGITWNNVSWTGVIEENKWSHLVFMYNHSNHNITLYVNGVSKGIKSTTDSLAVDNTSDLYIGTYQGNTTTYNFKGKFDEIVFFDSVIMGINVENNYFSGLNKLFKNMRMSKIEFNQRIVELKHNLVKQ